MLRGPRILKGRLHMLYLGLPFKRGWMSSINKQLVIEKVERWLEGWQAKMFSRMGWLVLFRSILLAIPIFHLLVF